jgi:tetracenomycin A2 monooxygenase-dioxygenase
MSCCLTPARLAISRVLVASKPLSEKASKDCLLDTYQEERRPIAVFNVEASRENAIRIRETGATLGETAPDVDEVDLDSPRGQTQRDRLSAAIAAQRNHFLFLGQEIGFDCADSSVVVSDGTPHYAALHGIEDPIFSYVPNARPGTRAPHCWLTRSAGEAQSSTLDLFEREFVLLVAGDPEPWSRTLDSRTGDIPLQVVGIGPPGSDCEWHDIEATFQSYYGVDDGGAVLVRPDGHVAWRSTTNPDPLTGVSLPDALEIAVGRREPVGQPQEEKTR